MIAMLDEGDLYIVRTQLPGEAQRYLRWHFAVALAVDQPDRAIDRNRAVKQQVALCVVPETRVGGGRLRSIKTVLVHAFARSQPRLLLVRITPVGKIGPGSNASHPPIDEPTSTTGPRVALSINASTSSHQRVSVPSAKWPPLSFPRLWPQPE